MNDSDTFDSENPSTLDPPGSIAVIGAGPLGVEAALYGRFLGYDVSLIDAVEVGHTLLSMDDTDLPILPNRSLSPLAASAIEAQNEESAGRTLPLTLWQWVHDALVPVTQTDLLRGRIQAPRRVVRVTTIPIESDVDDQEDIPPDYRLIMQDDAGEEYELDAEAVIVATGDSPDIEADFSLPSPYFFRIGATAGSDWEACLLAGLLEIVAVYASLAGREDLDLYRPLRG